MADGEHGGASAGRDSRGLAGGGRTRLSRKALQERPVTGRECEYRDGELIISRTNKGGAITYVNDYFCEISGYSEEELMGQPHNVIRHPDMPAAAFADMWFTIQQGHPWTGLVKNCCKNGDHYWVDAHVAPIRDEKGDITGYLSVRRKPGRALVAQAERDYTALRAGRLRNVAIRNGQVVEVPLAERLNPLWKLSLGARYYLLATFGPVLAAALLLLAGHAAALEWGLLLAGTLFSLFAGWWLARDLNGRCTAASRVLREMAGNVFTGAVDIARGDELGDVLRGIKSMQVRQHFQTEEMRREADKAARIVRSLDIGTNLLVADGKRKVTFVNRAMRETFGHAESAIAEQLPGFRCDAMAGMQLENLSPDPARWSALLEHLQAPHAERVVLGGLTFDVVITPVLDEKGGVVSYVGEWKDRTLELAVEDEIASVVERAAHGDLAGRIDERGKREFHLALARNVNAMLGNIQLAIQTIQGVLHALAEGDLTHRVEVRLGGAFGEMAANANGTVDKLTEMVGQIQEAVAAINAAAAEIASGNDDLSQRTEMQAASLEETASSMEELASTVQHNAANARNARTLAENAAGIAGEGSRVVASAVATMQKITTASHKIEEIIGVIDGIAFQTNILALNAAVEAARAGEQGRGFAVVAGEVRALAQRSATSAREIKALIESSVQAVDQGSVQVRQAGDAIDKLVKEVGKVSGLVADISAATDEQSAGVGVVNQAVTELDNGTQQNAALVEEASAAARSMADQAHALAGQVAKFRLRAA